jgi:hypothetical protein
MKYIAQIMPLKRTMKNISRGYVLRNINVLLDARAHLNISSVSASKHHPPTNIKLVFI